MKILVTGAAGFIGSHMAELLSKQGHEVLGIDNLSGYYDVRLKKLNVVDITKNRIQFIEADLVDDLKDILPRDIEVVYHFAAQPGISATTSFADYKRNNIDATHNLLEWSLDLEVPLKMFVNISTSSVYGTFATSPEEGMVQPISDYAVTKLSAEQIILAAQRKHKLKACSIRLFSVYGPRERPEKLFTKLIKSIIEQKEFPLYGGSELHERSFSYVGDIVDGLSSILLNMEPCDGEIINLGSDKVHTTGQGIRLVEEILEQNAIIKLLDNRSGDQQKTAANIDKARKLLNYNPITSFREGLSNQVKWYKSKFC